MDQTLCPPRGWKYRTASRLHWIWFAWQRWLQVPRGSLLGSWDRIRGWRRRSRSSILDHCVQVSGRLDGRDQRVVKNRRITREDKDMGRLKALGTSFSLSFNNFVGSGWTSAQNFRQSLLVWEGMDGYINEMCINFGFYVWILFYLMHTAFWKVLSLFQRMLASFLMRCCSNPTTRQDHLSHTKIRLCLIKQLIVKCFSTCK